MKSFKHPLLLLLCSRALAEGAIAASSGCVAVSLELFPIQASEATNCFSTASVEDVLLNDEEIGYEKEDSFCDLRICFDQGEELILNISAAESFGSAEIFLFSASDDQTGAAFPLIAGEECEKNEDSSSCKSCNSSEILLNLTESGEILLDVSDFFEEDRSNRVDLQEIALIAGVSALGLCILLLIALILRKKRDPKKVRKKSLSLIGKDVGIETLGSKSKGNVKEFSIRDASRRTKHTDPLLISKRFGKNSMKMSKRLSNRTSMATEITPFEMSSYKTNASKEDRERFEEYKSLVSDSTRLNQLLSDSGEKSHRHNVPLATRVVNKICSKFALESLTDADEIDEEDRLNLNRNENLQSIRRFLMLLVSALDRWYAPENSTRTEIVGARSALLSVIFIARIKQADDSFEITYWNMHKLFIVLFLIAAKITEDELICGNYWSDICGIDLQELNSLESVVFLESGIQFNVTPDELAQVSVDLGLGDILVSSFRGKAEPSIGTNQSQRNSERDL